MSYPVSYTDFYSIFIYFKGEMNLENVSNYDIDKFLWQYGKTLIERIPKEFYPDQMLDLDKASSILIKRIAEHARL